MNVLSCHFFTFVYSSACFSWKGGILGVLYLSVCAVSDYFLRILLLKKYLPHILKIIIFMLDMNEKELTVVHGLGVNLYYFNLLMLKIISSCIIHDIIIMISL